MTARTPATARRRRQLARLLTLADLQADAGRARLAAALAAERQAADAFRALQQARVEALAGLATDPPPEAPLIAATARWLRWQEARMRDQSIDLARLKAETATVRSAAGTAIARREVLRRLARDAGRAG
jgi:hypothetical protein